MILTEVWMDVNFMRLVLWALIQHEKQAPASRELKKLCSLYTMFMSKVSTRIRILGKPMPGSQKNYGKTAFDMIAELAAQDGQGKQLLEGDNFALLEDFLSVLDENNIDISEGSVDSHNMDSAAKTKSAAELYNIIAEGVDAHCKILTVLAGISQDEHGDSLQSYDLACRMGQSLLSSVSSVVTNYTDPLFNIGDMFSEFYMVEKLDSMRKFMNFGMKGDPNEFLLPGALAVVEMCKDIAPILEQFFPEAGSVLEHLKRRSVINIDMFKAWTAPP
jgi:hypothetical protein